MNNYSQIPHEWFDYQNEPAYFYTYYGDVYHGLLFDSISYEEGFFIVPMRNLKEVRKFFKSEQLLEVVRRLGWEIRDYRVIVNIKTERTEELKEVRSISSPTKAIKNLFIFGAGASTFCCYGDSKEKFKKDSLNPPMGFEIFSEKYEAFCKKFPGVRFSVPDLEMNGNNIEEYFEKDWQKYKMHYRSDILTRHINIQYFIRDLFLEISKNVKSNFYRKNLYNLFSNKLKNHCADNETEIPMLVSFNYDIILEEFLSMAFCNKYKNLDDYIDHEKNDYLLFKPHGSCNWGWRLNDKMQRNAKWLSATIYNENHSIYSLLFENNFSKSVNLSSMKYSIDNNGIGKNISRFTVDKNDITLSNSNLASYPALLLPYRDKDEFIMPESHQLVMKHWMNSVENITVIGWKGKEDLFNNNLKQIRNLKKLIIVNPDSEAVIENLKEYINLDKVEIIKIDNFEDYVINNMDNLLNEK